jgi:hypothetical protein
MTDLDRAQAVVSDSDQASTQVDRSERRKPQLPKAELKTALYALAFVVAGVACVVIQVVRNL